MQNLPVLVTKTFLIDPATQSFIDYVSTYPYLLIGMDSPDVADSKTQPVFIANTTEYEKAVAKFFSAQYAYDTAVLFQPEPRRIFYLDKLAGVTQGTAPKYLLTLQILEFRNT